jgi:hypothetical protein
MSDSTHTAATPTVVLVHGAFVDASSWNGVIAELKAAGLDVVAPPNLYVHRTLTGGIDHNLPQEAPLDFVHAIEEVDSFA